MNLVAGVTRRSIPITCHERGSALRTSDNGACAFTKRLRTAPYSTALQGLVRGTVFIAPAIRMRLEAEAGIEPATNGL